jgi:hypothetical protein
VEVLVAARVVQGVGGALLTPGSLAIIEATFHPEDRAKAIATFEHMRERNPSFRSPEGHLIYARALEASGDMHNALEEYEALARYYPGAEARARQALLYKKLDRRDRARELFAEILKDARLAPKHFRKSQREWIDLAERESARLEGGARPN